MTFDSDCDGNEIEVQQQTDHLNTGNRCYKVDQCSDIHTVEGFKVQSSQCPGSCHNHTDYNRQQIQWNPIKP